MLSGQEDPTQEFDGEVQITPFNMKEEMEEGHFDKEGTYIFGKREKDEIKDHWLDNIDWVKVNNTTQPGTSKSTSDDDSMDATEYLKKFDPIPIYKEMLTILQPGESVLKALKRLGGGKVQSASERWKKKKQNDGATQENDQNKQNIAKLTEHANIILSSMGNMDVYQETFEGIRYKIQQAEAKVPVTASSTECDMFGEMFEEKKAVDIGTSTAEGEPSAKKVRFDGTSTTNNEEKKKEESDSKTEAVQWEFKWKNEDDAEIHGPNTSHQMQNWVDQGYFESGVWVRRVGQGGDFYTSRRIDFELYL